MRKALGVTQEEMGRLAGGISKAAISAWETKDAEPGRDSILALQKNANVNSDWVLHEKGEMFIAADRHMVREQSAPYGASLRQDILHDIIATVEQSLDEEDRVMAPEKKAELFVHLYEEMLEQESLGKKLGRNQILKLVKLAS